MHLSRKTRSRPSSLSSSLRIGLMSRCLWDGAVSWMEPAFDETSMAWLMEQVYVGHELRALAPTLKGDLAAVKRFQLRPVRDAEDGGRTEFRREEFHELVLAGGIERRCRFIEHDNVGPMEEDFARRPASASRHRTISGPKAPLHRDGGPSDRGLACVHCVWWHQSTCCRPQFQMSAFDGSRPSGYNRNATQLKYDRTHILVGRYGAQHRGRRINITRAELNGPGIRRLDAKACSGARNICIYSSVLLYRCECPAARGSIERSVMRRRSWARNEKGRL